MSSDGAPFAGASAAVDADRAWQQVRASSDIQFAPLPPVKPPEPPGWLKWLGDFLKSIFEPLGRWFGLSWPVLQWILIGLGALLALFLLWRLVVRPLLSRRRPAVEEEEPEWAPAREEALGLLADADRLAAEGRFGEAAHLLLQRSVHHIASAQPLWLTPSSTAREIATLPLLSERARQAFGAIASRVERSLFALRELEAADWQAAREAYAEFALQRFGTTA